MKHIQKITLSILAPLALLPQLCGADMTFSVLNADTGTYAGNYTATGKAYKTGTGTAVFTGSNSFGTAEINAGTLSVGSASNLGNPTATIFNGSSVILKITDNINTGALTMTSAGTAQVQSGKTATLNAAPTGSNILSVNGAGTMAVASDLSDSSVPIAVSGSSTTLKVSGGSGKLPTAAISVASGAILELGTSVANGAVPGIVNIASGAIVAVAAGVSAPSNVFSNTTIPVFRGGSIIQLGANSTFSQAITVVP